MFNLDAVEELSNVVPVGTYSAVIVNSELKETKAMTGKYLSLEFRVFGSEKHEGRSIYNIYNVINPSEKAQQIGLSQLKSLGKAVLTESEMKNSNPSSFLNKKVIIHVGVKNSAEYGEQNNIKKYEKYENSPLEASKNAPF